MLIAAQFVAVIAAHDRLPVHNRSEGVVMPEETSFWGVPFALNDKTM
jgi:hypothetical protein